METIRPLTWEQRDWRKPYEDGITSSTWHAELPVHRGIPLYEIHQFDDGFFVWFCATPYKIRVAEGLSTLAEAKAAAHTDWLAFLTAALAS